MPENECIGLSRHAAFVPAASKGFVDVQQVLDHMILGEVFQRNIAVIGEKITQF